MLWLKLAKTYRWTLALWFLTFLVFLPFLAQKWVFSPFFYASEDFKANANESVRILNTNRFFAADKYMTSLSSTAGANRELNSDALLHKYIMAAMVITKKRSTECNPQHYLNLNCEPHYLQQSLAALDQEIKRYSGRNYFNENFVPTIICNVDEDWADFRDFEMVKNAFPVIYRHRTKPNSTTISNTMTSSELRSLESSDYAYCLEAVLNITNQDPKYILVLQDDAVAFPNFFKNLFHVLNSRIERRVVQGEWTDGPDWSFLKLYYPELWAGYGLDTRTLVELETIAIIGALAGLFLRLFFSRHRPIPNPKTLIICAILFALYAVLLAIVISRQLLLEIRRINSYFLKVDPAPGCCIPAVVYPTKLVPTIVQYLRSQYCDKCEKGVDLALDQFSEQSDLVSYLLEPNLVRHIGMHSTLTSPKDALPMLFHDLLYD